MTEDEILKNKGYDPEKFCFAPKGDIVFGYFIILKEDLINLQRDVTKVYKNYADKGYAEIKK